MLFVREKLQLLIYLSNNYVFHYMITFVQDSPALISGLSQGLIEGFRGIPKVLELDPKGFGVGS